MDEKLLAPRIRTTYRKLQRLGFNVDITQQAPNKVSTYIMESRIECSKKYDFGTLKYRMGCRYNVDQSRKFGSWITCNMVTPSKLNLSLNLYEGDTIIRHYDGNL